MRLVRFGPVGAEVPGVIVDDDYLLDVSSVVDDFDSAFFANGGIRRLQKALGPDVPQSGMGRIPLSSTRLGPPVSRPHKLLCIGLNYVDHALESGSAVPDEPVIFSKATNTIVGPNDDIFIPRGGNKVDFEVELGVVIGSEARYLPDREAAELAIAGYCISHDVSERSFQLERGGQWTKGKSCETFNPLGPWLVTRDEIPDTNNLQLLLNVNGEIQQDGSTSRMIFNCQYIVWYLSQFLVLEPGDVINTGTPSGVGMGQHPPRYLREGDVVELAISKLGSQRQEVRAAP